MKKLPRSLIEIVKILSDGEYHDGDTIGKRLGITRAGVWKIIKKLEHYDIKLNSIKGKGYALSKPLILLDENYIKKGLKNQNIDIAVFESIDSTNKYLKTYLGIPQVRICLSEHQTNGRGRMGRSWHSPFGYNIYFSCLYPFKKDISELTGLPLVVSLAIINVLQQFNTPKPFLVKWPNDVVYQDKKVAGNLIEIQAKSNGMSYAIIGIGLNVNMIDNDQHFITQPWISLAQILNKPINRNELCILLINNLMTYLARINNAGFLPFLTEWAKVDSLIGKQIAINNDNIVIQGQARGINNQGNLLIEFEDKSIKAFSSGEASIVKG